MRVRFCIALTLLSASAALLSVQHTHNLTLGAVNTGAPTTLHSHTLSTGSASGTTLGATGATGAANPPFVTVHYIVKF